MRTRSARLALLASLAGLAGLALLPAAPARACGGMVFPEHSQRLGGMSEQELLVAFTPQRTVILASAGYEGATAAPAFILPLASKPTLVAQSELGVFAALDDRTAPEIHISVADDSDSERGLCGAAAGGDKGGGLGDGRGEVMVVQRGETADYDWVLVAGDTGSSLADWLADAGYELPPDYADALQPYLDADDFVFAAKLKSDAAAGALAPIEIHLPPIDPGAFKIPFALAAHSLPPEKQLTITTYLLAEGGLLPANYPSAELDRDALEAFNSVDTNYADLYQQAVANDGEPAWVVESSFSDFSASALVDAYDTLVQTGEPPAGTDRAGVLAFAERVPFTSARLTRIRTTLGAPDLHDMTLTKVTGRDIDRNLYTTLQPAQGACGVDRGRGRGLPLIVLLVPLVLMTRRRRR